MMRQLAEESRLKAQELHDDLLMLASYRLSGLNALHFGEFEQARSDFENILHVYQTERHRPPPVHYIHDPKFYAIAYLPVIYWIRGFPEKARNWQRAALAYAAELNQAVLSTHVRIYAGAGLDELLMDPTAVNTYADAVIDLCDQNLQYFRLSG